MAVLAVGAVPTTATAVSPVQSTATVATTDLVSADTVHVCDGQDVSTVGPDGAALPQRELDLLVATIQRMCTSGDDGKSEGGPVTNVTDTPHGTVTAHIYSDPRLMTIQGWAVGVWGTGSHELQCTYRGGSSGPWSSCGYGAGGSSITTSALSFCPVPGILFHAVVALYINGNWDGDDETAKFSL